MTSPVPATRPASATGRRRRTSRRCSRAGRPTRRARAKLRLVLSGDTRVTLSALETRFLSSSTSTRLPLPADQPPRRRPPRRLPLARPPAHGRARQLSLPPLPPRLGAGPPPRARGPRPRRRHPALHVGRRVRGAGADDGRAPAPPGLNPYDRRGSTIAAPAHATAKTAHRSASVSFGSPFATVTSHQPGSTNDMTDPANATRRGTGCGSARRRSRS